MIVNLFRTFDPSSTFISIIWFIVAIPFFYIKKNKIDKKNKNIIIIKIAIIKIIKETNQTMRKSIKQSKNIINVLFIIIIIINIHAILPYNFTPSAHISITFTLSLGMWLSTIVNRWINNIKNSLIHLTPIGTPIRLINFIVVIELIRNLIRPITLSVRLIANIVAGHLLISLLSSFSIISYNNIIFRYIVIMLLISLEIVVALVQSYVLITLITLYHNETIK